MYSAKIIKINTVSTRLSNRTIPFDKTTCPWLSIFRFPSSLRVSLSVLILSTSLFIAHLIGFLKTLSGIFWYLHTLFNADTGICINTNISWVAHDHPPAAIHDHRCLSRSRRRHSPPTDYKLSVTFNEIKKNSKGWLVNPCCSIMWEAGAAVWSLSVTCMSLGFLWWSFL